MVKFLTKDVGILLRKRERIKNADIYLVISENIQSYQDHIQEAGRDIQELRDKIKNYKKIEVNGIGENNNK